MDMTGQHHISAPRGRVWAALNDPEVLRQCIPGCEELQKHSDTQYTAKVVAKVGPVKAKFSGKVTLSDLDPPNGYAITGEGSGGAAGFGKGGATVTLTPEGADATVLSYTAHASVGGKLAQIGSRLVDATARKMADDFFARFTEIVGGPAASAGPTEAATAPAPPGTPAEPAPPSEATSPSGSIAAAPDGTSNAAAPPEGQADRAGQADEAAAIAASRAIPAGTTGMTVPGPAAGSGRGGLPPSVWIAGVIALVVILLLVFT